MKKIKQLLKSLLETQKSGKVISEKLKGKQNNKIMCWNNVDTRLRIVYGDQFAKSLNPLERKFIIGTIAEEFPQFSRLKIAAIVDQCININTMPISLGAFLIFIQSSFHTRDKHITRQVS